MIGRCAASTSRLLNINESPGLAPGIVRFLCCFAVLIVALSCLWPSHLAGSMERDELDSFLHQWMSQKMDAYHVPGVIVVVVKNGELFYAKGFGLADIEDKKPMDPVQTVMRVGSISKLITATAVLKLHEEGNLDIYSDMRMLIDPEILEGYRLPINLHQLLTHSGGIGDKFVGQTVGDPEALLPLKEYLKEEIAPPLAPPGFVINYSNHGISLAALAVEEASGQKFANYVEDEILSPLGMTRSGFIPSPEEIAAMSTGYKFVFGGYRELSLRHWRSYPAASFVATGEDIAKFMIAHLAESSVVLGHEATKLMHRRQFTLHPRIPGIAYVFWEKLENQRHMLWHSGHMPGHRTALYLIPEERLGLYIYNNSELRLFELFMPDFLDRFLPPTPRPDDQRLQSFQSKHNTHYTGTFRHNWYPRTTFGKAVAFLGIQGQEIRVRAAKNGTDLFLDSELYEPAGPGLFRKTGGDQLTAFWEGHYGEVVFLYQGGWNTFHRLAWHQTQRFHRALLAAILALFLLSFAVWSVSTRNRRKVGSHAPILLTVGLSHFCAGAISTLYLFTVGAILSMVALGTYKMTEEIRFPLLAVLTLLLIASLASGVLFVTLTMTWKNPALSFFDRTHYYLLIVNALVAMWFLDYWNLLGYRF